MTIPAFTTCPRCSLQLQAGFAAKAAGLSFIAPDKFKHLVFLDEDLGRGALTKLLPSWAEYFRSYLCRGCELYIIDYSTCLSRKEAEALIDQG